MNRDAGNTFSRNTLSGIYRTKRHSFADALATITFYAFKIFRIKRTDSARALSQIWFRATLFIAIDRICQGGRGVGGTARLGDAAHSPIYAADGDVYATCDASRKTSSVFEIIAFKGG